MIYENLVNTQLVRRVLLRYNFGLLKPHIYSIDITANCGIITTKFIASNWFICSKRRQEPLIIQVKRYSKKLTESF